MTRLRLQAFIGSLALAANAVAAAVRPPEAVEADHAAAQAELQDLERRARSLEDQDALRREGIRRHLRLLYKLSQGAYFRLLVGAENLAEAVERDRVARRLLSRELAELHALREEATALDRDHARRAGLLTEALEADQANDLTFGPVARRGQLGRPVPRPVVGHFGPFHDPELNLERARRGVELGARPGELVRVVAGGRVCWLGDVPGLGPGIAIDHGEGYLSLLAPIALPHVGLGAVLARGDTLGEAAGPHIYLEFTQGGTPLDPEPWLSPAAPR